MATELNVKRFDQYWKSAIKNPTFNFSAENTVHKSQKYFIHIYCFIFVIDTIMKLRYIGPIKNIYCHKLVIIADKQHNLEKLGRVKVHSQGG